MKRLLAVFFLLLPGMSLLAQDAQLAQQYFRNGEYEKAGQLYQQLSEANEQNEAYFERFVDCLIALEDYNQAERLLKRRIRKTPENVNLYVTYGKVFEQQVREEEALKQYHKAIENLPKDRFSVIKLANAFTALAKYDMAIETYEKGAQMLRDDQIFSYYLADLYRRKGDTAKMIEYYLNSLDANPSRLDNLQTAFQRNLGEGDYQELIRQLYARIQENDKATYYPELLTWVFIQQKDYRSAFRQVRALDRRYDENGARVYQLAQIAANDRSYEAAIEAYDYIVERKGPNSSFYIDAKREGLRVRRQKLTEGFAFSEAELRELETQYRDFLAEFGRSKRTAGIILELAELEARYLNDLDEAIALLTELVAYPNVDNTLQAYAKIHLADYYLMKGDIWEATLLYSQVDKAFKEDILGHEARFRNAKLSYYAGDFQWAQAQFDVLKASTSKLIANDALDLSVFIMDNLGLDSTAAALQLYADADLLVFQNRFEDAFRKLDTLAAEYPSHQLDDDLLYLRGKIYLKMRDYEKAAAAFETIVEKHPEEIRADNALFELGKLYENQLDDKEKAKAYYETLFIDYSGSTFAVEARKRYRILRGDDVQ